MSTILNLAYGSNLLLDRIAARVQIIDVKGITRLEGWQLCFHKRGADGSGKCNLVRKRDAVAYGIVYEFSLDDKDRLDAIEGAGYQDERLNLHGIGAVSVYLAHDTHIDESLQPYDWYHRFVIEGARAHGFPQAYIDDINNVAFKIDPDMKRRNLNLGIGAP